MAFGSDFEDDKDMSDFETSDEWQAYVETNLSAPFLVSQAVLPYMKVSKDRATRKQQRAGSSPCIIHVSSFRMLQSLRRCTSNAEQEFHNLRIRPVSVAGSLVTLFAWHSRRCQLEVKDPEESKMYVKRELGPQSYPKD